MKWIQIQKRIFYYGQTKALVRGCSYACASVLVSEAYRSLLDPYASWTIVPSNFTDKEPPPHERGSS